MLCAVLLKDVNGIKKQMNVRMSFKLLYQQQALVIAVFKRIAGMSDALS